MLRLPISARTLHQRTVRLADDGLESASLFPFFRPSGEVDSWMLVWPESPAITFFAHRPGRVEVPMWGPVRVELRRDELRDLGTHRARLLAAGRWHYDPWWVLREPRFVGHRAVPILKATNCAGRLSRGGARKRWRQLYFGADLARVDRLTTDYYNYSSWSAEFLPPRSEAAPRPPKPAVAWRLDPIWERNPAKLRVRND